MGRSGPDERDLAQPGALPADARTSRAGSLPAPWLRCKLDEGGAPSARALADAVLAAIDEGAGADALARFGPSPCHRLWFLWTFRSGESPDFEDWHGGERLDFAVDGRFRAALGERPRQSTLRVTPCGDGGVFGPRCQQLELRLTGAAEGPRLVMNASEVSGRWLLLRPPVLVPAGEDLLTLLEEALVGLPEQASEDDLLVVAGILSVASVGDPELTRARRVLDAIGERGSTATAVLRLARDPMAWGAHPHAVRQLAHDPTGWAVWLSDPLPVGLVRPGAAEHTFDVALLDYDRRRRRHEPEDQLEVAADASGVLITAVAPGSLLRVLGLRPGDILRSVGEEATTIANVGHQLPPTLDAPGRVEVVLSRAGNPRTLTWEFK